MTPRHARIAALAGAALLLACAGSEQSEARPAASTLVLGIDVSGSFRDAQLYDDAIDFEAHYIYAHLNGLGGLRTPTALFVASVGGARPGEPKPFHPINDFQGRSVGQIAADLRAWFPSATSAAEPICRPVRMRSSATNSLPRKPTSAATPTQSRLERGCG